MKRLLTIILIIVIFIGGCTAILMMNKKEIDKKATLDGNLDRIPVYVDTVGITFLGADFEVTGSFSPIHELNLQSEGQGKVIEVLIREGDFVSVGQVIARLDDELLTSQLSLAMAAQNKARADRDKFEGLLKEEATSAQQVEEVRLAAKKAETDVATLKKQMEYATIKAPIQGTITRRYIEKGTLLMPGAPVVEIVDISRLKFIALVSEREAVGIAKGRQVRVNTSIYPGVDYHGTVLSVGVKADDALRFPVEITIENSRENLLRAGMFGTAAFGTGMPREALLITRNALVGSIKIPRIYVVEDNRAVLRDIRIGAANDHQIEVTGGLKPGEVVVVSGQLNLDNLAQVTIMNTK